VVSRGNNQANIFVDDRDRSIFLALLARAVDQFNLRVFAFCLMDNHYHLFLQTPDGNLSRAMQWLNTSYTVKFHLRHKRSGHFLQGRYKSILVTDESHWLHLSMYLHLNPVRAGMVRDPEDYEWSSYHDYIHARSRSKWLEREDILSQYGKGPYRYLRYRKECLGLIGQTPEFLDQLQAGAILGTRELAEKLAKKYRPADKAEEIRPYRELTQEAINVPSELEKVARIFGVKAADLKIRHHKFPPRLAAYYHLVQNCGMKMTDVARNMDVTFSAVSVGYRKFRQYLEKDPHLSNAIQSISRKIKA